MFTDLLFSHQPGASFSSLGMVQLPINRSPLHVSVWLRSTATRGKVKQQQNRDDETKTPVIRHVANTSETEKIKPRGTGGPRQV